jgi:transposase InsO family protein
VAAVKDLFAGGIVGRTFGERMTTELVVRAFEQAVAARRPPEGLIHHSDRGLLQPRVSGAVGVLRDEVLDESQGELL